MSEPVRSPALSLARVMLLAFALLSFDAVAIMSGGFARVGLEEAAFVVAQLFVVAGLVFAVGSVGSLWLSVLDTSVVAAVVVAVGAFLIHSDLVGGVPRIGVALGGPLLGIGAVTLVAEAALRPATGVRLSVAILSLAEIPIVAGGLVLASGFVRGARVDWRLVDLPWAAGVVVALVGVGVSRGGMDRRLRLPPRSAIPGHRVGARAAVFVSAGMLTLMLAIAGDGVVGGSRGVTVPALVGAAVVGVAMAVRAGGSIRGAEAAYRRCDRALAASEDVRDALVLVNEELAEANGRLRAAQVGLEALLTLADERTEGRLRQLLELAGEDLAELVEQQFELL